MSPRNWPDLTHGCKLSQLETTVQPIIHSGQHQVSRPSDRDQIPVGVPSCSSCLPSGVTLYWFSWAYLFLQEQQPNRLLQTLPKGCDFTDVHVSIRVIPSSDLVGSGRRKEVELGEALDKSKPQPCALLSASLPVPLSLLWVLHSLVFMFVMTFSVSSQKAQRLRAECPLQPQTSKRSGFCEFLCLSSFLKSLQKCYFTLASCWTWP